MIDRAIGVLGLALAIAMPFLQLYVPGLPTWVPPLVYAIAALLVGFAAGLMAAGGLRHKRSTCNVASLRLHIFGDHRAPQRLAYENIFRWFYLQAVLEIVGPDGRRARAVVPTLFVSFQDDVVIGTLTIRSPDMQLPVYEVKEFNQRYAIITFTGNVLAGTLEIEVAR